MKNTLQKQIQSDNISEEINKMFNKLQIEDYEFKKLYRSKKQD